MLKKTIKYTDFSGEEVEEDFFFHLSKAELIELEASHKDGMTATIERIIATEDRGELIKEFKHIVLLAYGKKSPDGRRFIKNQGFREEFESTEAYSTLFMELVTETDKAIEFFNGIVPADMSVEEAKAVGIDPETTPFLLIEGETDKNVAPENRSDTPEPRRVTRIELNSMTSAEQAELAVQLAEGKAVISDIAD